MRMAASQDGGAEHRGLQEGRMLSRFYHPAGRSRVEVKGKERKGKSVDF